MVAEAEIVFQQSLPVLDVPLFAKSGGTQDVDDVVPVKSSVSSPKPVSADLLTSSLVVRSADPFPKSNFDCTVPEFIPIFRSGSHTDIGHRRFMEDEHICIDDLSSHLGHLFEFPKPSAFYAVFDGHGGPEASAYVRQNAIKLFFEDVKFPQMSEVDSNFSDKVENTLMNAFLLTDSALADDSNVSSSSGTTALTALLFGRLLMVANVGDCRAVLCRKGEAIDMSQDHRPIYPPERKRVEDSGGFVDDGYLNGVLSVSRALGDWDMKLPHGSSSPLIAEPEIKQICLTEDDEFLILGCDGVWDVMSSQAAVSLVRRGLRRHDDPDRCARELVKEALRLNTFDNLTVIVVCFPDRRHRDSRPPERREKQRFCSLSAEALCSLRSLLEG